MNANMTEQEKLKAAVDATASGTKKYWIERAAQEAEHMGQPEVAAAIRNLIKR
jgi:hypothetical protein